jgi:hypothetical protein
MRKSVSACFCQGDCLLAVTSSCGPSLSKRLCDSSVTPIAIRDPPAPSRLPWNRKRRYVHIVNYRTAWPVRRIAGRRSNIPRSRKRFLEHPVGDVGPPRHAPLPSVVRLMSSSLCRRGGRSVRRVNGLLRSGGRWILHGPHPGLTPFAATGIYLVRGVPRDLQRMARRRAAADGTTLPWVLIQALRDSASGAWTHRPPRG